MNNRVKDKKSLRNENISKPLLMKLSKSRYNLNSKNSNSFLDGIKLGLGFIFIVSLIFGIVFAVGFHNADQILGGTFSGAFVFEDEVEFSKGIILKNETTCDLTSEGKLQYDPLVKQVSLCNGTAWVNLSSSSVGINYGNDEFTKLLIHFDGNFADSSASLHGASIGGNAIATTSGEFSWAGYFDGDGDYVCYGDSPDWNLGTDDFTIDFWIKLSSVKGSGSTTAVRNTFFGKYGTSTRYLLNYGPKIVDNTRTGGDFISLLYMDDSSNLQTISTAADLLSIGIWHHIAYVRNSGTLKIYLDGNEVASGPLNRNLDNSGASNCIGSELSYPGASRDLNAYVDEFRISKGTVRWINNFLPPDEPYS